MKANMQSALTALAAAAALAMAQGASAQSAGQWTVKAGVNHIAPQVGSGDVSAPALPHTRADVDSDSEPVLIVSYSLDDHVSVEADLGLPYTHTLSGAGAIAGTGKVGTVEALPPTVFIQYRFLAPQARLRPYLGLGATYAYFQKERGSARLTALTNTGGPATTFRIDNKLAATVQAGLGLALSERWFADLAVSKTFLKTTVHFSTGQTQDMRLDPLALSLGVGYKF